MLSVFYGRDFKPKFILIMTPCVSNPSTQRIERRRGDKRKSSHGEHGRNPQRLRHLPCQVSRTALLPSCVPPRMACSKAVTSTRGARSPRSIRNPPAPDPATPIPHPRLGVWPLSRLCFACGWCDGGLYDGGRGQRRDLRGQRLQSRRRGGLSSTGRRGNYET